MVDNRVVDVWGVVSVCVFGLRDLETLGFYISRYNIYIHNMYMYSPVICTETSEVVNGFCCRTWGEGPGTLPC